MPIIDGPPPAHHLVKRRASGAPVSALHPWFLGADEVNHVYARLEMLEGGHVLVVGRRRDVVGEAEAVEVGLEVHVQEPLVGTVERDASLGHGHHGIIVAHVRGQNHETRVEQVWPANVGRRREGVGEAKELIRGPVGHNIGVHIDDLAELGLPPEVDFGEGRVQVRAIHKVQVCGMFIPDASSGDHIVVDDLNTSQLAFTYKSMWLPWRGGKPALSCVTTSADTVSRVTKMANFLVVPASRSECANTRAPGEQHVSTTSHAAGICNWRCKTYREDTCLSKEAIPALASAL